METSEAAAVRERCAVHPDRPSVGRCESCGRSSCLECAVPFRGRLLCQADASRELGSPDVHQPAPSRPSWRPDIAAAALLGLGLLATVPPWHRSGTLTSVLSAWRPGSSPWSLVACIALVAAGAAAVGPVALRRMPTRTAAAGYALLAVLAVSATVVCLATAPEYISPTVAPFGALAAAAAAAAVGFARLPGLPRRR